ncbi:MAG: hypothetical protein WA867_15065 [Candidatus Acidiferrales bacterium]
MTEQEKYDSFDSKLRSELLLKIGETPEEEQILGQRYYLAIGGWVKTRLKRYWNRNKS